MRYSRDSVIVGCNSERPCSKHSIGASEILSRGTSSNYRIPALIDCRRHSHERLCRSAHELPDAGRSDGAIGIVVKRRLDKWQPSQLRWQAPFRKNGLDSSEIKSGAPKPFFEPLADPALSPDFIDLRSVLVKTQL